MIKTKISDLDFTKLDGNKEDENYGKIYGSLNEDQKSEAEESTDTGFLTLLDRQKLQNLDKSRYYIRNYFSKNKKIKKTLPQAMKDIEIVLKNKYTKEMVYQQNLFKELVNLRNKLDDFVEMPIPFWRIQSTGRKPRNFHLVPFFKEGSCTELDELSVVADALRPVNAEKL